MLPERALTSSRSSLLLRVGSRTCALPLTHVVETLRPLPVAAMTDAPRFVLGVSIIRGAPVAVVDLGAMIAEEAAQDISRFVVLRVGERIVALAVSAVLGVRELPSTSVQPVPPLLQHCSAGVLTEVGTLDSELLLVLRTGIVLPEPSP